MSLLMRFSGKSSHINVNVTFNSVIVSNQTHQHYHRKLYDKIHICVGAGSGHMKHYKVFIAISNVFDNSFQDLT